MKLVIIEDETHNQRLLRGMIEQIRPEWTITGVYESVSESVEQLKLEEPDLILMDIQLSDGICFSIFEQLQLESAVIFTTAYDQYAIRAFKVNSIDYLLKPIKEEELADALQKFEARMKKEAAQTIPDYNKLLAAIKEGKKEYRQRFMISTGKHYYKIDTLEVAYFFSENKITTAVTFDNKFHIVDFTLESLEEQLHPDSFFRTDRKHLININSIARFEDFFGGKLVVKLKAPFGQKITVSRLKASAFKLWMGK